MWGPPPWSCIANEENGFFDQEFLVLVAVEVDEMLYGCDGERLLEISSRFCHWRHANSASRSVGAVNFEKLEIRVL